MHLLRQSPSQDQQSKSLQQQTTTHELDLWKGSNMIKCIELPTKPCASMNGNDNTWFGCSSWSHNE